MATFTVGEDRVAVITLCNPPVNALHPTVTQALFGHLRTLASDATVRAVVITGAGAHFSAGFDIAEFVSSGGYDCNKELCSLVEGGALPTVAAVRGFALGGGLEVAMACNARVAAAGAKLGLPELQLGIIPGMGGTQRLPRLVGVGPALRMMITSKQIGSEEAVKLGLVDEVVEGDEKALMAAAKKLALDLAAGSRPRRSALGEDRQLTDTAKVEAALKDAHGSAAKLGRHNRHALLCIKAVQHGILHGGQQGLRKESECFATAASLPLHKALVHVFLAERAAKKLPAAGGKLRPRPIRRVAVLGGGLMGSGIATSLVLVGVPVVMKEVNQQFLQGGLGRVRANLASQVKRGRMSQAQAEAAMKLVTGVLDYSGFGEVDAVIEAVIEKLDLKQQIFEELAAVCPPGCLLASNTSTFDLADVARRIPSDLGRVAGAHFFSPAHIMALLEVVRTDRTDPQVVVDLVSLGLRMGKTPVVVRSCPGFAVNRVFFPYSMAACLLVDLGLHPYKVDNALMGEVGMPMGAFRLSDLTGADVGVAGRETYYTAFPDRVYRSPLLGVMTGAGRLGQKTGKGFYQYDAQRKAQPDPDVDALLEESRRQAGLRGRLSPPPDLTAAQIVDIVLLPCVNEAARVIAERVVERPADLDVASILGMGFPRQLGGLVHWADCQGAANVCQRLGQLAERFAPLGLAGFFQPSPFLQACATAGRPLGAELQQEAAVARL